MVAELDFTPAERPELVVDGAGALAAVRVGSQIAIVDLERGAAIAQIELDPDAATVELGWLGDRLLVLTRYAAETTAQLFDPTDLRAVNELWFGSRLRLLAAHGAYAVVVGAATALFELDAERLVAHQLTATVATAAGAVGEQVALAVPGGIELWDPRARNRVRAIPVNAPIASLGGNARYLWATTLRDPRMPERTHVLDVVPLDEGGRHVRVMFPEATALVACHPRVDVIACVGASGRLYSVHLDGSQPLRELATGAIERVESAALVVGSALAVLIGQANEPLALVDLDDAVATAAVPPPASFAPLEATVEMAKRLQRHTDLAPPLVAAIAAIDAMERGAWPAMPFERLLHETPPDAREELRAAIAVLVECGVVVDGPAPRLDPGARLVLAQAPAARAETRDDELARLLAPSGAVVVLVDGTPGEHLDMLRAATARSIAVCGAALAIDELRDLWLHGAIALLEVERRDELTFVERIARVPGRIVFAIDHERAGELLARLRRIRTARLYRQVAAPRTMAVPTALEPLVSATWGGAQIGSAIRVAGLRGTREAIDDAARTIAAAHGVALRVGTGGASALRDALAASLVVLLDPAALTPLETHVIAAMIERVPGVVLVVANEAPIVPMPVINV